MASAAFDAFARATTAVSSCDKSKKSGPKLTDGKEDAQFVVPYAQSRRAFLEVDSTLQ